MAVASDLSCQTRHIQFEISDLKSEKLEQFNCVAPSSLCCLLFLHNFFFSFHLIDSILFSGPPLWIQTLQNILRCRRQTISLVVKTQKRGIFLHKFPPRLKRLFFIFFLFGCTIHKFVCIWRLEERERRKKSRRM